MNLRTAAALTLLLAGGNNGATAQSGDDVSSLGIDGSGTTNPSKCFWHIMAKMMEQIKLPARMTYRAVGSGTGQAEFLGKGVTLANGTEVTDYQAYNDFGSGDIPIKKEDWEAWNAKGIEFVQLPFVLSAVSFFHSIPGVPAGDMGLNMTACLLARVFDGKITTWDHPDILDINPGLNVAPDYPIYVGRRVLGSSSTYSITHYLHAQCPQSSENPEGWPLDKTASKIEWSDVTNECDGSGLMTRCIQENEGAIGYIDSAHGHEELLTEIRILNGDGDRYLTSKEVGDEGIQAAATDLSLVPDSTAGDFSEVAFYNEPGPNTWPIALVSYVYIRKDLSFIKNPARRTLLKAFATALYDPDYIGLCSRFGHIPVPPGIRDMSLAGIDTLQTDAPAEMEWFFEKSTVPGMGQGDYVISKRRKNFVLYEADSLYDDVGPLKDDIRQLKLELASMKSQSVRSSSGRALLAASSGRALLASGTAVALGLGTVLGFF